MSKTAPVRRKLTKGISRSASRAGIKQAPDVEHAWRGFRSALAVALSDLDEDEYLVISRKSSHAFVQFAAQGAQGMRAEAVSNAYLSKASPLTRAASARLLDLGWNAPTYVQVAGETEPPEGSPNFYLDVPVPVPFPKLAALAVQSLREVYAARHPGQLLYKAWGEGPTQIRFPSLRIKREPPEQPTANSQDATRGTETDANTADDKPETVLEVGAEGGSLRIGRMAVPRGGWQFMALENEEALADLLNEEDRRGLKFSDPSAATESFATALAWLGRYPWERLYPLKLHQDYVNNVLTEVARRGGPHAVKKWQSTLSLDWFR